MMAGKTRVGTSRHAKVSKTAQYPFSLTPLFRGVIVERGQPNCFNSFAKRHEAIKPLKRF